MPDDERHPPRPPRLIVQHRDAPTIVREHHTTPIALRTIPVILRTIPVILSLSKGDVVQFDVHGAVFAIHAASPSR